MLTTGPPPRPEIRNLTNGNYSNTVTMTASYKIGNDDDWAAFFQPKNTRVRNKVKRFGIDKNWFKRRKELEATNTGYQFDLNTQKASKQKK